MSLLNDALRDLETRQQETSATAEGAQGYGHLVAQSQHQFNVVRLLIIMLLALLLLSGGWFGWKYFYASTSPLNVASSSPVNAVAPPKEILPDIKVVPTKTVVVVKKGVLVKKEVPVEIDEPAEKIVLNLPEVEKVTLAAVPTVKIESKPLAKVKKMPAVVAKNEPLAIAKRKNPVVSSIKQTTAAIQVSADRRQEQKKAVATKVKKKVTLSPAQLDFKSAEKARALYQTGQNQKASESLYAFIHTNEVDVKSRLLLASTLLREGNLDAANLLLPADKINKSDELRLLKARLFVKQGKLKTALALLQQVPATNDLHLKALEAWLFQQTGDDRGAVKTYGELLQSSPRKASWWVGLAVSLERLPDKVNAKRAYQKALSLPGLKKPLRHYAASRVNTLSR